MKLAPHSTNTVSTDLFTFKNKTFLSELSTLKGFHLDSRIYDDACDVGFYMKSSRTGKLALFTMSDVKRDAEGDLMWIDSLHYEITIKLDGTSCTIFKWENVLRVCSRNLELKLNEENKDNTLVRLAMELGEKIPDGFAFQGEVMGPGIQKNREGFKDFKFFVYDIFNIEWQKYLTAHVRKQTCQRLGLDHVPVFDPCAEAPSSVEEALTLAEGPSINNPIREGLVWKCLEHPEISFKAISNKFLLKGGE